MKSEGYVVTSKGKAQPSDFDGTLVKIDGVADAANYQSRMRENPLEFTRSLIFYKRYAEPIWSALPFFNRDDANKVAIIHSAPTGMVS